MSNSTRYGITSEEARFFLAPERPLQKQYEALRCFFVENLPSAQVAERFGYTPGAFVQVAGDD